MPELARSTLPIPEPLRASEIPSFTNYSVVVRLPDIARRTLAENSFPPSTVAQIQALIDEIPDGRVRRLDGPLEDWNGWVQPYAGMNWLEIPWFFAEEYFYVRILEATGYFGSGPAQGSGAALGRDPYASQKRLGLESLRGRLPALLSPFEYASLQCAQPGAPAATFGEAFHRLLMVDLWGNQNDLSLWPVQKSEGGALTGGSAGVKPSAEEHILSNDMDAAARHLEALPSNTARIDILLDNAGYELVTDLALADFLLSTGRAAQVVLHAKSQPVFVSDALVQDIHDTLDFLLFEGSTAAYALARRLRASLLDCRMLLKRHPFWTSPLPAWEMPADLSAALTGSNLLIAKGDANYRRLLGDRHWPLDLPFASVVDYLPCPALALRTLKSEIAVGIDPQRVPTSDPNWMINGRWGLVQFAPGKK